MDCRRVNRILDAFVAGELPGDTENEVRAHVESCAACRLGAAQYAAAMTALAAAGEPTVEAGGDFHRRLSQRLDGVDIARGRERVVPIRWHFVGSVAAAAAAVFVLAVYVIPHFIPAENRGTPSTVAEGDSGAGTALPEATFAGGRLEPSSATPSRYYSVDSTSGIRPVSTGYYRQPFDATPRIYIQRFGMPTQAVIIPQGGYVTLEDYKRLEDRIKGLESRIEAVEQGRGDISK